MRTNRRMVSSSPGDGEAHPQSIPDAGRAAIKRSEPPTLERNGVGTDGGGGSEGSPPTHWRLRSRLILEDGMETGISRHVMPTVSQDHPFCRPKPADPLMERAPLPGPVIYHRGDGPADRSPIAAPQRPPRRETGRDGFQRWRLPFPCERRGRSGESGRRR